MLFRRNDFWTACSGSEPRKTGWMRAEAAGDPGPWRQQAILGPRPLGCRCICATSCATMSLETLADDEAVLVIDETGFLKQGKASCGVARQYTGSAGKITNCQIGVFAAYVSRHGHAFIDRALYLPKEWTDDPERMAKARMCRKNAALRPSLQIARKMIEQALAANVPFGCVAADSVYGVGDIETALRRGRKGLCSRREPPTMCFRSWGKNAGRRRHCRGDRTKLCQKPPGGAFRPVKEPKDRGCTIGPISNWPISMQTNTTMRSAGIVDARPA